MKTILCTVLLGLWLHIDVAARAETRSLPNVLIIYADDLGYGDVRCNNPERSKIPTPHMDRLASEGIRFTDGHSSSGVCSPSRYSLLTGRYHWRSRLQRGIVNLWEEPLISRDRRTIAGLVKRKGYRTACIGKWHLGWEWPIAPEDKKWFASGGYKGRKERTAKGDHRKAWERTFSRPIPGGPTAVGFDRYFGTDVPNWPPYCFIEDDRTVGIPSEFAAAELFEKNMASQQGPALKGWILEPILPALRDRAVKFIEREAQTREPFLLYLPLTTPHTPLAVNEKWKGKSGINALSDLIMETDATVGAVLDALEESGAAGNTLVVFTSDNGSAHYAGVPEQEKAGHFPSGPFRGYKADAWEGGHRVPFIVRWPGVTKPGRVCDALVHQADIFATIAAVVGEKPAPDEGEDSFSLVPLLRGASETVRSHAVSASVRGVPAVRSGPWKYIPVPGSGGWGKGGDQSQPVQLYHLDNDPGETNNLAGKHPDQVERMKNLLEKLIANGRSNEGPVQANDVEVRRH